MAVTLGHNQYGKAEIRVVRVFRDTDPHEIADYNVSVAVSGDFAEVHRSGDNRTCLTTDAMKNTVNSYAKEAGDAVRQPESFAVALAKHFVADVPQVDRVRIRIEAYPWDRLTSGGSPHPHAFSRRGSHVRTATVTAGADGTVWVVSGVRDLVVLKTTDSEFHSFYEERYTTLQPTTDRIMATSVTAQWLHTDPRTSEEPTPSGGGSSVANTAVDWGASHERVLATLTGTFAGHHSLALQQTLYAMGENILAEQPGIAEIRFSLPNKHHFVVDLSPFGVKNDHEVFHADDRPYGYIEGTVRRDDAPNPGPAAFDPGQGW
jgi:urate oxidase